MMPKLGSAAVTTHYGGCKNIGQLSVFLFIEVELLVHIHGI